MLRILRRVTRTTAKIAIVGVTWGAAISGVVLSLHSIDSGTSPVVAGVMMGFSVSAALAVTAAVSLWDAA